jgi:hypothetical protein
MATKQEIAGLITAIEEEYPKSAKRSTESVKIWCALLADIEYSLLRTAVLDHISQSIWPPTIAELRARAAKISMPHILDPMDAWGELKAALKRLANGWVRCDDWGKVIAYVREHSSGDPADDAAYILGHEQECQKCRKSKDLADFLSDPIILAVAENMDVKYLLMSDDEMADRAHFLKHYQRRIERAQEEATRLPQVNEMRAEIAAPIGNLAKQLSGGK